MTMPSRDSALTDDIIEAGAQALGAKYGHEGHSGNAWREIAREDAAVVLAAVLPLLRTYWADQIRKIHCVGTLDRLMREQAESLVRGGDHA
jgi:hypothetical protein